MQAPVIIGPSRSVALAAAAAGSLFVVAVALSSGLFYRFLDGEDGFVENASALAYVAAAYFAVRAARAASGMQRAHWILWVVLSVLFFGEETSWLQQWLHYATPASVKAVNVQAEFNIHNLKIVSPESGGRVFGSTGARFSWKFLLSSQHLFNLGFTIYFLLLPLASAIPAVRRLARRLGFPELRASFLLAVWSPIVVSIGYTVAQRAQEDAKGLIAETREMFFAFAILWLTAAAYRHLRRMRAQRLAVGARSDHAVEETDTAVA